MAFDSISYGNLKYKKGISVANPFPPLTVTSVDPNIGDIYGGSLSTLTGTNFKSGALVFINEIPATSVVVVNSTTITCRSPARGLGTYTITVINPDGRYGKLHNSYEVWSPTQLTNLDCYVDSRTGITLSGSSVTNWLDQSPNSLNFISGTFGAPTFVTGTFGTQPGINFFNTNKQDMALTTKRFLPNGQTMFFVGKTSTDDTNQYNANNIVMPVIGDKAAAYVQEIGFTGTGFPLSGGRIGVIEKGSNHPISFSYVYTTADNYFDGITRLYGMTWKLSTGLIQMNVNGIEVSTEGDTNPPGAGPGYDATNAGYDSIGSGYYNGIDNDYLNGDLGVVIVLGSVISQAELTKLHKWARSTFGAET